MKKILPVCFVFIALLSSCAKTPQYKTTVYPSEILSIEDFAPYFDYQFEMADEIKSRTGSTVTYVSSPLGKDPVIVRLFQYNGLQDKKKVKSDYENAKNKRTDAFDVPIGDIVGFVAYPKIHYYINGYHVEITAGSGTDDAQKSILVNLANISLENLRTVTGIQNEEVITSEE